MVAYNFRKQFAGDVESGKKRMTIRRSRRANVGDIIQLYTGQRTRGCRFLGEGKVVRVDSITITDAGPFFGNPDLWPKDKHAFAAMDGFESWGDMLEWFKNTYHDEEEWPFRGWITVWELVEAGRG